MNPMMNTPRLEKATPILDAAEIGPRGRGPSRWVPSGRDGGLAVHGLRPSSARKQGIALVVVLGFLSVLVILAVAFAIIMRTERLVSRNYIDVVRSRLLVQSALAHILADELKNNLAGQVYPPWDAWPPGNGQGQSFLDGGGSNYVPWSLKAAAMSADVRPMIWKELKDQSGKFWGKYAFIVVNNSGLLDGNVVAEKARSEGFDPGEIRAEPAILAEMKSDILALYRREYGRFESIPELYLLGCYQPSAAKFPPPSRLPVVGYPANYPFKRRPEYFVDNFHVYSRYPRGYAVNTPKQLTANANVAYIGGEPNGWNIGAIQSALADLVKPNAGYLFNTADDRDAFIRALYDYADESYVPYGATDDAKFKRISAKPVPMINEVIVKNRFQLVEEGGVEYLGHQVQVIIETWYPFPKAPGGTPSFTVNYIGKPTVVLYPYTPNAVLQPDPDPPPVQHEEYDYRRVTYTFSHKVATAPFGYPPQIGQPPKQLPLKVRVQLTQTPDPSIEVRHDNQPVDRVYGPWNKEAFDVVIPPGDIPSLGGEWQDVPPMRGLSTDDPRINWDASNKQHWDGVAVTPGAENAKIDGTPPRPADEFGMMYCRLDDMQSVGEVGYLLYNPNKPWTTVRLMGPDPDGTARILDRLTVHAEEARRGLVNINTRQTNALAAVFFRMPLENYPGHPDGAAVTSTQAVKLVRHTVDRTRLVGGLGPITNLSDIATRWQRANVTAAAVLDIPNTNKFYVESAVRNSIGLWGTRQNLFTIMVAARVFSDKYAGVDDDNFVTAEQRALAVVWWDPFLTMRGKNYSNENFVRYFHWLVYDFDDPVSP